VKNNIDNSKCVNRSHWDGFCDCGPLTRRASALKPIDLSTYQADPVTPDFLGLAYPQKLNLFYGMGESLKTWAAFLACKLEIDAGNRVAWIDLEDSPGTARERLSALGADLTGIDYYGQLDGPITEEELEDIGTFHTLVVIDSTSEWLSMYGLDGDDREDVVLMHHLLKKTLCHLGCGVILIDHSTKGGLLNGPSGSERKVSGIDGSVIGFERDTPFGRGRTGVVKLSVKKDRPGYLRGNAPEQISFTEKSGVVTYCIGKDVDNAVMEFIGANPGCTRADIEKADLGKRDDVRASVTKLVRFKKVNVEKGKSNAQLHTLAA